MSDKNKGKKLSISSFIILIAVGVMILGVVGYAIWQFTHEEKNEPMPLSFATSEISSLPEESVIQVESVVSSENSEPAPVSSNLTSSQSSSSAPAASSAPPSEGTQQTSPASSAVSKPWKQAYINYIRATNAGDWMGYQLIYINNDDIPELYLNGAAEAQGDLVCTFANGTVVSEQLSRVNGMAYLEKQNVFCNSNGNMGRFYDVIYSIQQGQIVQTHEGVYGMEDNANPELDENGEVVYQYSWDGQEVSETEYKQKLNAVFNQQKAIHPSLDLYLYSKEEILAELESM